MGNEENTLDFRFKLDVCTLLPVWGMRLGSKSKNGLEKNFLLHCACNVREFFLEFFNGVE